MSRAMTVPLLSLSLALFASPVLAQDPPQAGRRESIQPVTPADYGRFETPASALLSPDGQWLAYVVNRVNEHNELRIRHVARDTVVTIPFGGSIAFSGDSRYAVYAIGVSPRERDRLNEAEEPVRNRAALLDLRAGSTTDLGEIAAFQFSPDGAWLALNGHAGEGQRGSDLIIRDLDDRTSVSFGNVSSFAWATDGALLALTLDTENRAGNAVQLYDPVTGTLRVLDSSRERYTGLAWRDGARDIAVLRT